ncbi:hypothetical protein KKC17_03830 [Patescibacteria group bacterium]|nr:hypothetical protein [Patescibacteria group bacterium]
MAKNDKFVVISNLGQAIEIAQLPDSFHASFKKFDPNTGNQVKKFKGVKNESGQISLSLNGYCGVTIVTELIIGNIIPINQCGSMTLQDIIIKKSQFSQKMLK